VFGRQQVEVGVNSPGEHGEADQQPGQRDPAEIGQPRWQRPAHPRRQVTVASEEPPRCDESLVHPCFG